MFSLSSHKMNGTKRRDETVEERTRRCSTDILPQSSPPVTPQLVPSIREVLGTVLQQHLEGCRFANQGAKLDLRSPMYFQVLMLDLGLTSHAHIPKIGCHLRTCGKK